MFEENENISFEEMVRQFKEKHPTRMDVPNNQLFQYARKTWRDKKAKAKPLASPAHAHGTPAATGTVQPVKKKPGPKPKKKLVIKQATVIPGTPPESPVGGMLEKLEADLDKLIATAGEFKDKDVEAMSRKMRRQVSSRILALEEVK
jgi:hypothetical protein